MGCDREDPASWARNPQKLVLSRKALEDIARIMANPPAPTPALRGLLGRAKESSAMFERIVAIDWSGAAGDTDGVNLAVALADRPGGAPEIVKRPGPKSRKWSREACRHWLRDLLAEGPRTLVAMDFGFGYPWGTDEAVFGVKGWRPLVEAIRRRYEEAGIARGAAESINASARLAGHGPFRFDGSRTDYRFYVDRQVAYYRLTDLLAPQAISQWYLGSGGTVGFHSITGLAAIGWLAAERDAGRARFEVWPHEVWEPSGTTHVLVECYPSLCPKLPEDCPDEHQRDALKVLRFLQAELVAGRRSDLFKVPPVRCGRVEGVDLKAQVQFEGYMIGLR